MTGRCALQVVALSLFSSPVGQAETLRVFAASSLGEAFRELAGRFEGARPGTRVELNLAGSQVLRTQLEHGAGADVFAGADHEDAERLLRSGLLEQPLSIFARNRLAIAVPVGSTKVHSLADLARAGVRIVTAALEVPAGRYAARVLVRLGEEDGLGRETARRIMANVISRETSVRAALAKVVLGEADAGFVYASDVHGAPRIGVVAIPEAWNVSAEYVIAVCSESRQREAAAAFVALVLGDEGALALRRAGFAR